MLSAVVLGCSMCCCRQLENLGQQENVELRNQLLKLRRRSEHRKPNKKLVSRGAEIQKHKEEHRYLRFCCLPTTTWADWVHLMAKCIFDVTNDDC